MDHLIDDLNRSEKRIQDTKQISDGGKRLDTGLAPRHPVRNGPAMVALVKERRASLAANRPMESPASH